MADVKRAKSAAGATPDPNATQVWRLGRLPYRSSLKMADIRRAVKNARDARLAAEAKKSEA